MLLLARHALPKQRLGQLVQLERGANAGPIHAAIVPGLLDRLVSSGRG
jgi:hypothetical protein